jgi:hypothetical protein
MLFQNYRKLSQRDRALVDGRLITYHFYVGGVTLLIFGFFGLARGEGFSWVAVVFGFTSLALGLGLHLFHRHMIQSSLRDSYLATITAALGRHKIPLLPSLLGILVLFSLFVTILFIATK